MVTRVGLYTYWLHHPHHDIFHFRLWGPVMRRCSLPAYPSFSPPSSASSANSRSFDSLPTHPNTRPNPHQPTTFLTFNTNNYHPYSLSLWPPFSRIDWTTSLVSHIPPHPHFPHSSLVNARPYRYLHCRWDSFNWAKVFSLLLSYWWIRKTKVSGSA